LRKLIASIAIIISSFFIVKPVTAGSNAESAKFAINLYWCGKVKKRCQTGDEAFRVAGCETGGTYNIYARNGQYLGIFQMGSHERARFGHGWNVWDQAKAAHKYYVLAGGWQPWTCRWAA